MITRSGTPLCPAWCIALHLDADKTLHYGASREVSVVTRAPASHRERQQAFAIDTLVLVQHQERHERVPWLAILLRDGPVLDLTVDSARRLGANLTEASAR
ncbi:MULTISPECIES: DUF6907 domain-containing protein [unclassified Pseudoclavibacter]|uniref:DUF6907 domain-containing protein n=1 Tax=unclassified Pseudoclavibacter TaxID=2615177 RepID=UPI001BA7E008|nr:hypothetical protein [Pseudoclavibacter sp. Marseille-Q4354]MBS3178899.1 hypothetical protein [Pseudoclavibacter sp. Marseille-Q4354]